MSACELWRKEREYFKELGLELPEKCILETAIEDFDVKTCRVKETCKKYVEILYKDK